MELEDKQLSLIFRHFRNMEILSRLLFFRSDLSSEEGRASARYRAITLTAIASAFSRGISILTTLISLPLTLNYLGTERFGMWATLSAFALLLSFMDLGIGNSVLTAVARSPGRQNKRHLVRIVSSAYIAMTLIAVIVLIALTIALPFIPWAQVFNVSTPTAAREAGPAAAVFFIILALTGPVALVNRIQSGLQEGFRSSLWQSAANLTALFALIAATSMQASLPWLVFAVAGTPLLIALVNSIHYLMFLRPDIKPRLSCADSTTMRQLAKDGILLLILQSCSAVMFQANPIIVAQVLDANAVAAFAVPDRLFGIVSAILGLILMPLWPAYGDAIARGDVGWARRTLKRSLVISIALASVISIMLGVLLPTLINWWVPGKIDVSLALIVGLAVWKVMEAAGNAVAMFLNGVSQLGVQVACALVTVGTSVALKVWLTGYIGVAGIPLGMILAYGLMTLPVLSFAVHHAQERIARS